MKKLRSGRKAVSSIIGGIIILILILTALTSVIFITQQYDAYENTVDLMSQKDIDRSAEGLLAVYPGIIGPQLVDLNGQSISSCPNGASCFNQYSMTLSNLGGVGIRVARIYVNSTSTCDSLCILSASSTVQSYSFDSSASFINPAETGHIMRFWLNSSMNLPQDSWKANTVSLATSRGRVFTFQWPFPPSGDYAPLDLHADYGPIRIIYDPNLITFTMNGTQPYKTPGQSGCANVYPSSTPCLQGGWTVPIPIDPKGIVFYLRLSNIGYPGNVIILEKSYILARGWNTGVPNSLFLSWFYVIRPMPAVCQRTYFNSSYLDPTWSTSGSSSCPTPTGSTFQAYNLTGAACVQSGVPCYQLPAGPSLGFSGKAVYVLFSATLPHQSPTAGLLAHTTNYALYLQLYYLYNGYEYSSTIPLISVVTS